MIARIEWLLCEIFGYAGDHGWAPIWMDTPQTLTDGRCSAGYLMVRTRKGVQEFRHMSFEEEAAAIRSGESY